MHLNLTERIALKSVFEHGSLHVSQQLSKRTAKCLLDKGLIEWQTIERKFAASLPKGTVTLTAAGQSRLFL